MPRGALPKQRVSCHEIARLRSLLHLTSGKMFLSRASRLMVLLTACLMVLWSCSDYAYASLPPLVVSQAAPQGHVVSLRPFTWTGSDGSVSVTESFVPQVAPAGLPSFTGSFDIEDATTTTGAVTSILATSRMNADHSVTVTAGTADNPVAFTNTYSPGSLAPGSICDNCIVAMGLAAGADAVACILSAGIFCVATAVLTTAGAAAYCMSDPCGGDNPSCTNSSLASRYSNPNTPQYNLEVNSTVECTDTMDYITMSYKVYYSTGALYYSGTYPTCYNEYNCGYSTWFDAPTGHCYYNVLSWSGQYHNPATNEYVDYGASNVKSGTACT